MRRPNGQGSVYKLKRYKTDAVTGKKIEDKSIKRRKPWAAVGWVKTVDGRTVKKLLGTYETRTEALIALGNHVCDPLPANFDATFKKLYDEWSAAKYPKITKSTENGYRAAWLYFKILEDKEYREIKTPQYQAVIDLNTKEKSRSTLEKIKTLAVMLGDYAMTLDIVKKNYASYIELPPNTRSNKKSFTEDELKLIEKAAEDGVQWVDCVLMMCYTGFRITEFLSITKQSYDATANTLTGGIKTEAGKNRIIPIHPKILPYVKLWAEKGGERLICQDNGKPWRSDTWRDNCYKPCLNKIEGVRKLDPHECRHTFATRGHAAGIDDITLMTLMGHSDPKIDAETYIHVSVDTLKGAIDKL